ncbi:MAG TPA: electron transfer flavoprotein subunit beta, partial [Candidatus Cloacimonetes bacterium]|nr:electron transfer flavoprotein subunit beta [Candidatus Cloacimonadota bacterium]
SFSEGKVRLQRLMEEGVDTLEMELPGLITVVREINNPRLPSLRGKRQARNAELNVLTADDLGLDENLTGLNGSPTQVVNIFTPKHEKIVEKFDGDSDEAVELIVRRLDEFTKR